MSDRNDENERKPKFLHVVQSTVAALFGVQSHNNRERDFTEGRAGDYIGVFTLMVVVLIAAVAIVVGVVVSSVSP